MARHTIRLAFAICIALFGGTAFAQDTIGTTNYPTSGYEPVSTAISAEWGRESVSVMDPVNEIMYVLQKYCFVKVPLPLGSGAVQTVELNRSEESPTDVAVDPAGGYLYLTVNGRLLVFATNGRGEKPTRIGSMDAVPNGGGAHSLTVNLSTGDLFVGTLPADGGVASLIKYRRGTGGGLPQLIGSVPIGSNFTYFSHGFIDAAGGYGVFTTASTNNSTTYRVTKVDLGSGTALPQVLGTSAWSATVEFNAIVGNAPSDTCYVSHQGAQYRGFLFKLDVSGDTPLLAGTYTSPEQVSSRFSALGTDADGAHVLVGGFSTATLLVRKIETAGMTAASSLISSGFAGSFTTGGMSQASGRAYLLNTLFHQSFNNMPNRILEVDPGVGSSVPTVVSSQPLPGTVPDVGSVAVDPETGHAYVGGTTYTSRYFSKVGYFPGTTKPPEYSSTFWDGNQGTGAPKLAFDPTRRKLFRLHKLGVSNPVLDKFEPGVGGNAPTLHSSYSLPYPEGPSVFDYASNLVYVAGGDRLTKIWLGEGTAAPAYRSVMDLGTPPGDYCSLALDPIHRKLYAGWTGSEVKLRKISLGAENASPTLDAVMNSNSGEVVSQFIAIDAADGYGIMRLNLPDGRLLRFSVDGTTNAPQITGILDIPQIVGWTAYDNPDSAYLDTEADALYIVSGTRIHRVETGGASGAMAYGAATVIEEGRYVLKSIVPSGPDEFLVGTAGEVSNNNAGLAGLIKVARRPPSMKNRVRAVQVTSTSRTAVEDIRFYSHAAAGKLRFVIYSGSYNTVWTSPEIVNNVANGEIVVPISTGTPSVLNFEVGIPYYLGFVSDSDTPVASYVSGTGTALPMTTDSGHLPILAPSRPDPVPVSENWSIYATLSRLTGLHSIQILDADGANGPLVGFTNERDVLVATEFNGPLPEMLEISDNGFFTSTILPYDQTLPFTLTRVTDGTSLVSVRGLSSSGPINGGWANVTLDTARPTATISSDPVIGAATPNPTTKIRVTTSEPLRHTPDPGNPAEFELTNCSAGAVAVFDDRNFEFTVTHLADGQVEVKIPSGGLIDRAGNTLLAPVSISYRFVQGPPIASLTVPQVVAGSNVSAQYQVTNVIAPPTLVQLYSRRIDAEWGESSLSSLDSDSFTFVPGIGQAGTYYLHLRAVDNFGRESAPIPTGMTGTGMKTLHYNPIPNAPASIYVTGSGSYYFAMEDDVLVRIDLSNVSGSGTLTVSREEGDLGPFAGTGQMIEERLNIAYAGFTFGDATLETSYEDENLGGLHESSIVTAARVRGASEPTFFPITHDPSWNRITVHGITNLRDTWYFGRVPSPAANWAMYE